MTPASVIADAFEDLPHAREVLGTLDFDDEDITREWAQVVRRMGVRNIRSRDCTALTPLGQWLDERREAGFGGDETCALVTSGVALADLVRIDTARSDGQAGAGWVSREVGRFVLPYLAGTYPDLTLHAGIGWALLYEQAHDWEPVAAFVAPWAQRDLIEDGWLYASAGLSPEEAAAGVAAGTLTRESARVLAVLRAAVLPVEMTARPPEPELLP